MGSGGAGASAKFKKAAAGGGTFSGHEKLSPKQHEAVTQYQEGGIHGPLNAYMRDQRGEPGPWVMEHVPHLDAAIDRSRVNKDINVYRGITIPSGAKPEDFVGITVKDPAYLSTSTERKVAEKFAGSLGQGVMLKIRVKAGSKALHVHGVETGSKFGAAGGDTEHEVLLPRGSSYKVTGAKRRKDGVIVLTAELQ